MRTFLSTLLFWSYVILVCPLFFAGAVLLFVLTKPFDRNGRVLHMYTCFWAVHYIWIWPQFRLRIEGRHHIDRRGTYVLAANHQSAGDIPVMFGLFKPYKFVAKHQMFRVPFIGWNMSLNRYVSLVRGNSSSVTGMMKQCREWLDRGVSIMMFPEGTRSRDGKMLPFKAGAFTLAREAGVPVVPIVLEGTLEALPKDGVLRARGTQRVRVVIGEPIDSKDFPDAQALSDAVRARMLQMQAELRGAHAADAELDLAPAPLRVRAADESRPELSA